MKRPTLSRSSGSSDSTIDNQVQEAVTEAIRDSDDKVVEIRPANESKGLGKFPMMLLIGGALAISYWLRKSGSPSETLQGAASQTADRTKDVTEQAAETIQEGGETVAERVEEGSEMASEQIEQTGEQAAEKTEEAGEKASEKAEAAEEKAEEASSDSSGDSDSS